MLSDLSTADGRFVSLSPLESKFWINFCNAVEHPEWIARQTDPMPQTALKRDVAEMFAAEPLAHWEALLGPADCCYQAVLDYREVADHPHIQAAVWCIAREHGRRSVSGLCGRPAARTAHPIADGGRGDGDWRMVGRMIRPYVVVGPVLTGLC